MAKRTIIEIADRVGVSPATVSRALNNVPGVSSDKRRQILAVAQELDYHPNAIARSLQGQRTNTLAYVAEVGDWASTDLFFFKDFVTALAERCASYGLDLLIHPATRRDGLMHDAERVLRSGRADGLILADIRQVDPRVDFLVERRLPFVAFGRCTIRKPYTYVDVDGEWGIYVATRHLIERGHRQIGFLGLPLDFNCAADRHAGYLRALHEYGLLADPDYIVHGLTNETETRAAIGRMLDLASPPSAFVAASDMVAISAINYAALRGLRAGADFAITGFDDLPLAAHTSPALTTVRQPMRLICTELINRLVALIGGDTTIGSVLLRPELIVRDSS